MGGLVPYNRNQGDGSVAPWNLGAPNRKYSYTTYPGQGIFMPAAGVGSPSGVAQTENWGMIPCDIGGVLPISYAAIGAQTLLAPAFASATGLDWGGDQTDNDGWEIVFGGLSTRGKHAYTIGSNPKGTRGFFARITFSVGNDAGTDGVYFGFRLIQAFNAAFTGYTDYAAIAVLTSASPMLLQTTTRKNSGSVTTVSTTLTKADGIAGTYGAIVDDNGVVSFTIDGVSPAVGGNLGFQFDAGDVVVPFAGLRNDAALASNWRHTYFESGYNRNRAA